MNFKLLLLVFLIAFQGLPLVGQIFVNEADSMIPTNYELTRIVGQDTLRYRDPIFIVKSPAGSGFPVDVNLKAKFYNGVELKYEWYQWSNLTLNYQGPVFTQITTDSSKFLNQPQGGYKVVISGKQIDTLVFRAWICINYFKIDLKMTNTCEGVELRGYGRDPDGNGKPFYYHNPIDKTPDTLKNGIKYVWTGKKKLDNGTYQTDPKLQFNPNSKPYLTLYKDHRFLVTGRDSLGNQSTDSIDLDARATKAFFYASRDSLSYPKFETDTAGEAPFRVMFIDTSYNAKKFTWTLFDSLNVNDETRKILMIHKSKTFIDSITYYRPAKYDVQLLVEGPEYSDGGEPKRCIDSLRKLNYIDVFYSKLITDDKGSIQTTVFFPDEGGINSRFKPVPVEKNGQKIIGLSLQYFEIYIYSRWGALVYQKNITGEGDYNQWEGWNGEIHGKGIPARPGVYFYVIRAKGWDGEDQSRKGFVYLFRN